MSEQNRFSTCVPDRNHEGGEISAFLVTNLVVTSYCLVVTRCYLVVASHYVVVTSYYLVVASYCLVFQVTIW